MRGPQLSAQKRCPRCDRLVDRTLFSPNVRTASGLDVYCKPCNAERSRLKRVRYAAAGFCCDCGRPRRATGTQRYCVGCARRHAAKNTLRNKDDRLQAVLHYGGGAPQCACCGEAQIAFLTLDHIFNDGSRQRRELNLEGSAAYFRWLKKNGYPTGLQVLCHNCNSAKRVVGECSHLKG